MHQRGRSNHLLKLQMIVLTQLDMTIAVKGEAKKGITMARLQARKLSRHAVIVRNARSYH